MYIYVYVCTPRYELTANGFEVRMSSWRYGSELYVGAAPHSPERLKHISKAAWDLRRRTQTARFHLQHVATSERWGFLCTQKSTSLSTYYVYSMYIYTLYVYIYMYVDDIYIYIYTYTYIIHYIHIHKYFLYVLASLGGKASKGCVDWGPRLSTVCLPVTQRPLPVSGSTAGSEANACRCRSDSCSGLLERDPDGRRPCIPG